MDGAVSSFKQAYTQGRKFSGVAARHAKRVAELVSTPAAATDILNIAQAFGHEKVGYWDISYGSVICATYALYFACMNFFS